MSENPTAVKTFSAFILGATGEIGKEVLKALVVNPNFSRVVTISRRKVEYPSEGYEKVEQRVVDFEKLSDYTEDFGGFDVGFCALGTTRARSGNEGYIRVDHDYVLESAKLAKQGGCKHFVLVTSVFANKNSRFLALKVKGQVEEDVKELGFERLSIFRPALVLSRRERPHFGERPAQLILGALDFGRKMSVKVADIAKCMIICTLKDTDKSVEIFENSHMTPMSKAQNSN